MVGELGCNTFGATGSPAGWLPRAGRHLRGIGRTGYWQTDSSSGRAELAAVQDCADDEDRGEA